jgi:hypothetical protein
MTMLDIQIEGIGFWAPGWPDWNAARTGLREGGGPSPDAPTRPMATILTPAERRRAPDPVLLACEIAVQASAASGRDISTMASVFSSTHGDLVIMDYMCATLARAPREMSPIRFHNSVHNAPAGYWTIAAHCHAASTSITGWHASFAAGLFETAVEAIAGDMPVLLVAYDTESRGPLIEVSPASAMFGVAMVLAPVRDEARWPRLRLASGGDGASGPPPMPDAFATLAAANPMAAGALPLLFALANEMPALVRLAAGAQRVLTAEVHA